MFTSTTPAFAVANCSSSPLGAVGTPDAEPLARLEAKRHQGASQLVDPLVQLGVAVAQVLVARHERVGAGDPGNGSLEVGPDRLAQQRHVRCAVRI